MAHPIAAPAITMKKHSSMRNLFAVKDQIPAMVANISANPKYREYCIFTWFGISLCVSQKDIFEELFYDCLCFITDGIHLNAHSPFGIGRRITYLHLQTDFRISLLVNSEYPYLSLCTV